MKETRIEYWQNGNKHVETNYLNGKKHGTQTHYHLCGMKTSLISNFVNGFEDGLFINYGYSRGVIIEKISLKNDVLHGVRMFFNHEKRKLK